MKRIGYKIRGSALLILLLLLLTRGISGQSASPVNILFIAVDDLNCDFGAYGNRVVKSPNLDRIAEEGILFTNNHCQKAVCGPSRASMLSGFTPEHTGITNFYQYLRDMYPDVVTLPQFFRNNGYTTVGMGKIHDFRNVSETDQVDMVSWTDWINVPGRMYAEASGKPVTEMADVEDDAYTDGRLTNAALDEISRLAADGSPFFLAVGYKKPHLPFAAPRKYWDLYDRDSISLAAYRKFAGNDVAFVHNPGAEFINGYDNVPSEGAFSFDLQRKYIHGYYACVSYIDAQIGMLRNALIENGLYENTIIVIWGDHGFSLGDHTNWGKHTNFEYSTRCPLIIRAPGGRSGFHCASPTELLDVYPTLVDIAGFSVPDTLDGTSLLPIIGEETDRVKSFAVSQYRRSGNQGFALRSDYYQYVEWENNDAIVHQQLFDFVNDPYQTQNLYLKPEYSELIDTFSFRLSNYLGTGENSAPLNLGMDADSLGIYRKVNYLEFSVSGSDYARISPLEEASVSIEPLELPTSSKGYAALNLQPGSYAYSINKRNYISVSGTIQLDSDTLISDTLVRTAYDLTVILYDSYTRNKLSGVNVTVDTTVIGSDPDGRSVFSLQPGDHEIYVAEDGYITQNQHIDLQSDTVLEIGLVGTVADIHFRITDGVTPVTGATVNLNNQEKTSNSLGICTFNEMERGIAYEYTVSRNNYNIIHGSVIPVADTTLAINYSEIPVDLKVRVIDSRKKFGIPGCELLVDRNYRFTDDQGEAIFSISAGSYNFALVADRYADTSGQILVTRDTVLTMPLDLVEATIKFRITCREEVQDDVMVNLGNSEATTNSLGMAVFHGIIVDSTYGYMVSKEGLGTYEDAINVRHDSTLNIDLSDTWQDLVETQSSMAYPVPALDYLIIESEKEINEVLLCDLTGKIQIRAEGQKGRRVRIDTGILDAGIYIVRVRSTENDILQGFKIIIGK